MNGRSEVDLTPRKRPRQVRSTVTVDAIFDATIQVLRTNGKGRLTTTRVADRAGVSVGSLYQYFPHKNALLFGALQRHMDALAVNLEAMCQRSRGQTIDVIAEELTRGYIDLKVARAEDRRSFYPVVMDLGMDLTRASISHRMELAVGRLLSSAVDVNFDDAHQAAAALMGTMRSAAQAATERAHDRVALDAVRSELTHSVRSRLGSFARTAALPVS